MTATAATAGAAAFLVACGGDDEPSSTGTTGGTGATGSTGSTGATGSTGGSTGSTGTSGLLTPRVDTSAGAKPGGRFAHAVNREPSHFDGKAQGQVQLNTFNQLAYEALVANKPGEGAASTWTEVLPELAESWESSPDNLTITFKIRQGVNWQDRPPISGRAFDAEDVQATWERYETAQTPNNKFTNSNNLNPEAPIISMTAVDPQTLEIKLARPATYLFQRLSTMITGELGSVYPKEAGDTFDPEKDQIGTGPWMLDHFTPSVELVYKVNPDYWGDKNLFGELHFPVIPEYAARLAQFRTGALSTSVISPEDMVVTKEDEPDLSMYQLTLATNSTGNVMRFGWLPIGGKPSPFLDIRLRQALHMAVNRDEFIDAFSNVGNFEASGVPVNTYYYTTQGYVPELTLDPRGSEFGEGAEFYAYNMEEAKKLFDAAQSAYGGEYPEIKSHSVATVFGPTYISESEAMDGYARELGLNIANEQLDYNTAYLPNFVTKQGQFEGILYGIGAVTSGDMTDYYLWRYYSKTGATSGQLGYGGPDGSLGDGSGDPEADALIQKATEEFDEEARVAIFHELQRYLTPKAYMVPRGGFADTFALAWPAISNFAYFQNDSRVNLDANLPFNPMSMWFDESQRHG